MHGLAGFLTGSPQFQNFHDWIFMHFGEAVKKHEFVFSIGDNISCNIFSCIGNI